MNTWHQESGDFSDGDTIEVGYILRPDLCATLTIV